MRWKQVLPLVALAAGSNLGGCGLFGNRPWIDPKAASKPDTVLLVWADADPDEGPAPLTVKLVCDPITRTKGATYVWDFNDATANGEGHEVTHTYKQPGEYRPKVFVTDSDGQTATDETIVNVEPPSPPKKK